MNDLGKRLDDLAGRATAGTTLLDPSRGESATERPFGTRSLVIAVAAIVSVVAMLAVWQGGDGPSTSVVAGQGEESVEGDGGQEGGVVSPEALSNSCDLESIMPVLRAGLPTYDYEPAGSFAALAEQAAVVVTGKVLSAERVEVNGGSYVDLVVRDVRELATDTPRPEVDVIAYNSLWADRSQVDPLVSPIAFDGLAFVGFLSPWSGVRGGWAPGPEGLYIGCGNDGRFAALIENSAGPGDVAEPTIAEFDRSLMLAAEREARDAPPVATDDARRAEEARVALEEARTATEDVRRAEEERIAALGIAPPTTIAEARALWEATGITDYRLSYIESRPENFISAPTLHVEDGEIVDTAFAPRTDEGFVWTVDDLFDLAESVDDIREIAFDRTRGFPTVLRLNPDFDLPGDEFSVREITLETSAELAALDARIQAWLPAPTEPPQAIRDMAIARGIEVTQVYLLHEFPELDAFAYVADGEVCVVVIRKMNGATEYRDGAAASCAPASGFANNPISLTSTADPAGPDFLIVVQSLDAFELGWTPYVDVGRMVATQRSALLIVDDDVVSPSGQVVLEVTCFCGNQTHFLPHR